MRAAYVDALGDASAIKVGPLPDPVPGPGQVLVRVSAVAVDAVDTYVRSGRWRTELGFPLVLGRDLVGVVEAVGDGVTDVEPGEQVWTSSAGYGGRAGATAELVPVERDRLYRLPDGADPVRFVAAVHPATTAYGVVVRAGLRPGETLAVVGANGAVGMCLVQVASALGARVVATTRDPRPEPLLRDLGAAQVVVSDAAIERLGSDVDVFVDTSGRVDVAGVPEHLAPRGRIVLIAGRGRPALDVWDLYTHEIQVLGFVMSAMTVTELAAAAEWINAHHRDRPLRVGIGAVRNLDAAAEAHEAVEAHRLPRLADGSIGRFVLRPQATVVGGRAAAAPPGATI